MKKKREEEIHEKIVKQPKREEYFRVLMSRKNMSINKQKDIVLIPFILLLLFITILGGYYLISLVNPGRVTHINNKIVTTGILIFGILLILAEILSIIKHNKSMEEKSEKLNKKYGRTDIENIIVEYKGDKHNRRFLYRNNKRLHYKERYYIYKYECRMTYYDYEEIKEVSKTRNYDGVERGIYDYRPENYFISYEYDFNRLNKKLDKKKLESEEFEKYLSKLRKYKWIKSIEIRNNRLRVIKEIVNDNIYEEKDLNNDIDDVEKFYKDLSKELLKK